MPVIAMNWKKENPLWCQVVGPPGSGKTEHLMLLSDWTKAKFVSRLTKNSLISGFRPDGDLDNDPSFINELNDRLLVIKDFTCILQGPKEERDAIVGQLRDIFDGKCSKVFGNIGFKEYTSRFNILLAVTNVIDGFYSVNSQLGERFITRREYGKNRKKITEMAMDNILGGVTDSRRDGIKTLLMEYIEILPFVKINQIYWPSEIKKKAVLGADLIASCRSHVMRDSTGKSIASRPSPEIGTRLVTQIIQTIAAYCIMNGLEEVTKEAWEFGGARILCDTMPVAIGWILNQIYEYTIYCQMHNISTEFTIKEILPITRLGWNTTSKIITDLFFNGILEATYRGKTGRRNTFYNLSLKSYNIIQEIQLFNDYQTDMMDVEDLITSLQKRERAFDE